MSTFRDVLTRRAFAAGAGVVLAGSLARGARADTPLRIGVLTEMGGPYAEDSGRGFVASAQFAIDDFRQAHGGLPVDLVSADAQTKPDVASAIAGAWFDRDGVDMIIDVPVSSCALAVATVAQARNKVAVLNTSTSALTGAACSPNHVQWRSTPTPSRPRPPGR